MGLDDFSSSEKDTSDSSSTDSKEKKQTTVTPDNDLDHFATVDESEMRFYGKKEREPKTKPMGREGVLDYSRMSDLAKTVVGEIHHPRDEVKFHLPIFTIVKPESEYEISKRYSLLYSGEGHDPSWSGRVITCIGGYETKLKDLIKETVLIETGSTNKVEVMDRLSEKFGRDVEADDTCWVYFFGDTLHLRDLAQANEVYRNGERIDIDKLVHRILHPSLLRVGLNEREKEK